MNSSTDVPTLCIRGGKVVLPDRVAEGHSVWVRDGRILTVAPDDASPATADVVVEAGGRFVGPGFVDLHCHGGGGTWVWEDPARAAGHHLQHGTTTLLATTALLETHEDNLAAVAAVAAAIETGAAPTIRGINMEGPYLNPDFGAFRERSMLPRQAEYLEFATAARGHLRVMTIAPEVAGTAQMVQELQVATGGGVTFSVGHSRAGLAQIAELVPAGLRLATHLMNATGAAHDPSRWPGTREVGVDEAVLLDDGIWAEVIADADGRHVRPEMLRLIAKVKGSDRIVAVTDCAPSSGAAGPPSAADDVSYNERGELAGSSLTMDRAVSNLVRHTGMPLPEAWRAASHNPAAAVGMLDQLGQIRPGRRADLVVADGDADSLAIHQVWLGGQLVHGRTDD